MKERDENEVRNRSSGNKIKDLVALDHKQYTHILLQYASREPVHGDFTPESDEAVGDIKACLVL